MASAKPAPSKTICSPVVVASGNGAACGMPARPGTAPCARPEVDPGPGSAVLYPADLPKTAKA